MAAGGTTYASGLSYYPNGAIKQFTYGNGIIHTMAQNTRQLPSNSADGSVSNLSYTFDGNGNVKTINDAVQANHNRAMSYDELDRLVQASSPVFGATPALYEYDALDNLTRVKTNGRDTYYCYDTNNHLEAIRNGPICTGNASPIAHNFEYDIQGNVSLKDNVGFDFDYGNRLREATGIEKYRYDAYGRRILANRLTGATGSTGVIFSQYSQSGQLLYQENTRAAVNTQTDHIYLGGSLIAQRDEPLAGGSATIKYQHTDALGSPVAVTSSTGTVLERMDYEPYGQRIGGIPKDGPGYTGHVLDLATGMNYMQQRYYDALTGRFMSVDPVTANTTTGENFNRYWYADNNPYTFVDPDGREKTAVWLLKLTATGIRKLARISKEQAVMYRRQGKNIGTNREQLSSEIETAAHGVNARKDVAHELADGSKGLPHYQTDGKWGHSFWGKFSVAAVAAASALDQVAQVAEAADPISAMTNIPAAGPEGHECATGCGAFPSNTGKDAEGGEGEGEVDAAPTAVDQASAAAGPGGTTSSLNFDP